MNQQLSITALSSAALVVSILSGVWLGQHERLSQRLDDSVVRLKREAEAHRLVVETAMLASAETKLTTGARKLLEFLDQSQWVSAVCFWDTRDNPHPSEPQYSSINTRNFPPTESLAKAIQTGDHTAATESLSLIHI